MFGDEKPLKGVNLGGWLVLEKWITPSLFEGLKATDEYTFCQELGELAGAKLKSHRNSFITAANFKWLAKRGIDAVRLPVGFWLFGDAEPFIGCAEYVDFTLKQAQHNGLKVVLDLHAAPGSQNGNDHSGRAGEVSWHKDSSNIDRTLDILKNIAAEYGSHPSLIGIELLNEPGWHVPFRLLRRFYERAYEIVRQITGPKVAVIISDGFEPGQWFNAMPESTYKNLVIDMHLYQVFTPHDRALSLEGHISKALNQWRPEIEKMRRSNPVIIGEWSAELQSEPEEFINDDEPARRYSTAQLQAFGAANGWFFWTYKTESRKYWSLRDCLPAVIDLE
jgi:glucan 1,3-beta-glucosidase